MRILHLLEPSTGGVAVHVADLVRAQVAAGDSVAAVVADRDGIAERLRAAGADVATAPWQPEITQTGSDVRVLRMLVPTIRAVRPDVVHTHSNKAGVLGRLAARVAGVPVVHSAHGFAFLSQAARPRRGQRARRALTLGIERALAPLTAVIVCVSDWERREALAARVARPDRLVTVYNGVDLPGAATADPRIVALRATGPLVGYLARLEIGKGPLLFLDAVERAEANAVVIGDGPDAATVRARSGEVPVLPFPGTAQPALAALDVYVAPSYWEALGIGALEAMAAGLPVVATAVGGLCEVVVHGETGLLVAPDDAVALAAAIGRLVGDPDLRARMGAAGRARCAQRFSPRVMHAGVRAAYARAVA